MSAYCGVSFQKEFGISLNIYIDKIENFSEVERCDFFRVLAHSLTVSIRVYLCDNELDNEEKLNRVKWLNEILHRVVTKVYVRPYDKNNVEGFFEMMADYIEKNPNIYDQLEHCFNKSFHRIRS